MGDVIRFPRLGAVRRPEIMGGLALSRPAPPPPAPAEMQHFKPDEVRRLLAIADEVSRQATSLVSFIDDDRSRARSLGVETVAIELGALVESDGFIRARDALAGSLRDGDDCSLTLSGLDRLRRGERLWNEAQSQLRRKGYPENALRPAALGGPTLANPDSSPYTALIVLGGVAIGVLLLLGVFGGGR